ncbi:MAG: hypothetical protein ILN61_00205 [Lachnospiraceae bacterium]|nr:hypothetical protein [Lachnospiraceae bacterium]
MSNMNDQQFEAHLWLSRMWFKDNEIESYERRKAEIISQLSGIGKYDSEFVPANTGENSTETKNIEYSLLCEKIDKLITEISVENMHTTMVLDNIKNPTMHSMMYDRYINRMSWGQIQNKYHYAQRQPYRIVHDGLIKIRPFIPDDEVLAVLSDQDIQRG